MVSPPSLYRTVPGLLRGITPQQVLNPLHHMLAAEPLQRLPDHRIELAQVGDPGIGVLALWQRRLPLLQIRQERRLALTGGEDRVERVDRPPGLRRCPQRL